MNGAAGRALLHDLDKKFDDQDRLMKYMMEQMSSLED
jgi:hypothetical protein